MIPIYEANIYNFDDGIYKISLVDSPAVLSDFIYFKNQDEKFNFSIDDEEQHMITGVIMRADFPIYRYSEKYGEFYMKFSKETIKKMAEKMMMDKTFNNINLQHEDGTDVEGVNMVEVFIKDSEKGISPRGFEDIEEGSLFATYKVENEDIWKSIKEGEFKGFSLEGLFNLDIVEMKKQKTQKYTILNKMNKFINKVLKSLVKFGSIETDKGELFWVGEADLQIGDELFYNTEDEEAVKVEDGDYTLKDGTIVVVKDGLVSEIKEKDGEQEGELDMEDEKEQKCEEEVIVETPEEDPKDEKYDELKAEIDDLKAKYEELKGIIDELANEAAAEPIVEEFENKAKTNTIIPAFGSRSRLQK